MKETERAKEKKEKQKKKKHNKHITIINERKTFKSTAPKSPRECLGDVPCCLCWRILFQNHLIPKGVGTEMRALVASWGLLLRDEGAWSAVEVCRGLLAGHIGGSRVPKEKV